jgi:hypothetical protein
VNFSELSIKRPVFAIVISLLIAAFGYLSYAGLPLRELPDIDPPVVSVQTTYTRRIRQCRGNAHNPDRGRSGCRHRRHRHDHVKLARWLFFSQHHVPTDT